MTPRGARAAAGATALALGVVASPAFALDPPHDATTAFGDRACDTCHVPHNATDTLLDPALAGGAGDPVENLCRSCHHAGGPATEVGNHQCAAGANGCGFTFGPGTPTYVSCTTCHDPHRQDQNRLHGSVLGKFVSDPIWGPDDVARQVIFTAESGPNSFADGDATYDGVCEVCHTQTAYHRNDASGDHAHNAAARCTSCHPHADGFRPTACGGCHDLPPATGTHLLHAALAEPVYGDLGTAASAGVTDSYAFGCGNCHPLGAEHHINGGLAEVELYDPAAPAGSLKALAAADASYVPGPDTYVDRFGLQYTLGTCTGAYCHSGMTTASGDVPIPEVDFPWVAPLTPASYVPPYEVTRTRVFPAVQWGGSLDCGGCHGYPPRSTFPETQAGVGDSHSWIDASGYENLHMYNMSFAPVPCCTCHYDTLTAAGGWVRDAFDVVTLDPVPIARFDRHVNGAIDFAFDTVNAQPYRRRNYMLGAAVWDPNEKTCANVGCHLNQTLVWWGQPYRWDVNAECDMCHRYYR